MPATRIRNNQIIDATITGAKLVNNTVTGGLLQDDLTYGSNLTITGNLTVNGTTTTVDTTNTLIADPLMVLSRGESGTPSADSGIVIERGTASNAAFIWDESADEFAAILSTEDGTTAGDVSIASYADFKVGGLALTGDLAVGNLLLSNNDISSTDTNGDVTLSPNGTGDVKAVADTFVVGDANADATITTNGTGDLIMNTNAGTDSGSITIADAANGNITLAPNGTGEVVMSTATISDLTSGRVVLAGASGAVEDSANLTFDGSELTVTGAAGISGDATVGGTFGVTGEATLASATVSDLTSGRVVLAGTSGAIEDSGNLTFDGSALTVTGDVAASGDLGGATATITGNATVGGTFGVTGDTTLAGLTAGASTLASASITANATVGGTLGVTGEATLASATVSDLTSGRVVLAGTSGAIEDSGNLTFDGSALTVTGGVTASGTVEGATITDGTASLTSGSLTGVVNLTASGTITGGTLTDGTASLASGALTGATTGAFGSNVTVGGTLGVTGEATLASATVSDLTATRLTFAGASGSLTDSANLTFDGTNVAVTGGIDVTGDLDVDNININGNAITSTNTDGNIALTPNGTGEVVASSMSVSDLTDNRIVVAGTAGSLEDDANFTWDGTDMGVTGGVNVTGDLQVDNLGFDGNVISSTNTNGNIDITPNGTGSVNIAGLTLAGLTADRVLITNASGATDTDDNLTWDGTDLDVTGAMTIDNITIDGDTISSVHSEIIIDPSTAGAGGTVTIAGNLNVTGTTTTVDSTVVTIADPLFQLGEDSDDGLDRGITALYNDGAAKTAFFGMDDSALEFVFIADATDSASVMSGSLGSAAFGSLRVTDLTDNRVLLAGATGEIEDSGNLTFDGSTLAVTGAATVSTTLSVTGAVTAGSTLDVTGLASLDGGIDVDGAFTVADTSGNVTTTGTLDVTGLASLDGGINVDDAFTVADTSGNVATTGTLSAGETTLTSATVSDLTSGRVVLAGTSGAIEDSGNLTFDGSALSVTGDVDASGDLGGATLTVTGNGTVGGTFGATGVTTLGDALDVTGLASLDGGIDVDGAFTVANTSGNIATTGTLSSGAATLSSAAVSDLTAGRVVLAGTAGELEDNANLAFDGSTLAVTGALTTTTNVTVGGTLGVTGEATFASATVSDVTATHIMFAGTDGAVEGSADLAWDGSTLDVTGAITSSTTVTGATITDGTASLASGSLTSAVNVTASGTVTGGTLTDGTASIASGSITSAVNGTFSGTLTGGTLTDGTASLTGGALSGATTGAFSSNVTVGGTLGVTGESTLASATISDLTDGRVLLAGTSGAVEDSGNLTFNGTTLTTTAAAIDNVGIDANSITGTGNLILEASAASAIIVNEAGADVDFRVEGTGEANALFVEGSSGNVGIKTATPTAGASLHINSTDSMIIPSGTTAQRPGSAAEGMTRFNTTLDKMEFYNGSEWLIAGADFTIITADSFDGDDSTTAFTLSESSTSAGVMVAINGIVQDPGTSYSVSGTTLTFTEAPATNDNIDVRILTTTATVEGADSADKWVSARTITLSGDVSGSVSIDGSTDVTMTTTVVNDSHTHDSIEVNGGDTAITVTDTGSDGNIEIKVDNTVIANFTDAGLMPNIDSNGVTGYDLGSSSLKWRDLYLSSGSLYIDGQKVVESDSGTIVVSADEDQSLTTKVSGSGVLTLQSSTTVNMSGTLQMSTGKKITDQGGNAVVFGDKIDADNNQIINVGTPTADGHATTKGYVDTQIAAIATDAITEGDSEIEIADLGTGTVGISVDGAQRFALTATGLALTVPVTVNGATLATQAYADQAEADANTYTDTAVANLVDSAPGTLDTLNELAAALGDDANFSTTVTNSIATKLPLAGGTMSGAINMGGNNITNAGTITGTLSGNASTASALGVSRTISLGGDLSGSASFDGSANVTITATVAANSVALGTDTTGNYVGAGATSGNGISGSVSSEGGTFTVASNATSANTANTIVYRDASGNFSAGTVTATATQAQYADLAENYTADAAYEAGTVVSFGGDAEVTANAADMDRRVAGVVSTDPAHLMNADCAGDHVVALALQGRVPCKVTGAVAKGDIMVAAGNGMARAEADPKVGTVIGKALEAHAGGEGVIEVAVGRF